VIVGLGSVGAYELPTVFTFSAATPGVLFAFISGFDNDEFATVTIETNSLEERLFPTEEKRRLHAAALSFFTGASTLVEWGFTCPFTTIAAPECALLFGATGALTLRLGFALNQMALDPADPNFTTIASPMFPPIPAFPNSAYAPALLAMWNNESQAIGYLSAAYVSMNRAQGAFEAGDEKWRLQQIAAVSDYMDKAAERLSNEITLRQQFQAAWSAAGLPTATASPAQLAAMETRVQAQGLPEPITSALTNMGADAGLIQQFTRLMIVQDVSTAAGSFPANLTRTDLISPLQEYLSNRLQLVNVEALARGINLRSAGTVPIRIVASPGFDARSQVSVTTLHFGRLGTEDSVRNCHSAQPNVDPSGSTPASSKDLVCLISIQDAGLRPDDLQGVLTGKTTDGRDLRGVARLFIKH
jgi:hypothetical protein